MTMLLAFCIIAALLIVLFACLAHGQSVAIRSLHDIEAYIVPVDMAALMNLYDPRQDQYLRAHLTNQQYAVVRRERDRAGLDYVRRIAANAAVLLRANYFVRLHSSDENVRRAAAEAVNMAVRTRTAALKMLVMLYLRTLFPSLGDPLQLGRQYQAVLTRTLSFCQNAGTAAI